MEKISRRRDLVGKDRLDVQEEVISLVESEPEKFIALYEQLDHSYGGRYINADLMKVVLPHYGNKEERARYNAALQNSSATLAREVFRRKLEEDQLAGRGGEVVTFVTGMPSAGKTPMIHKIMGENVRQGENILLTYEGLMADAGSSMRRVQQVMDAGFQPHIVVVHNTAIGALDNTLKRFEETGRGGDIDLLARVQGNLPGVLEKIEEKYGNSVQLTIVDQRDPEKLVKLYGWPNRHIIESEGGYERIKERLSEHLEQYKRAGRISPAAESQAKENSGNNPRGLYGGVQEVGQQSGTGTPDYSGLDREAKGSSQNRRVLKSSDRRYSSEGERVEAALSYVDPHDRERWVKVAFAVKDGLGDAGFDVFDQWSRTAKNYDKRASAEVWRSAKPGAVTVASLYFEAKKNGYQVGSFDGNYKKSEIRVSAWENNQEQAQKKAAHLARTIYFASDKAHDHPYLARKGIVHQENLHELRAQKLRALLNYIPKQNGEPLEGRILIIPVGDHHGLTTLEFIDEQGRKSAMAAGRKAGAWADVENANNLSQAARPIYITEGAATALSIKQALGDEARVVAALSDTNLKNVALSMRAKYPDEQIIVCADMGSEKKAMQAAEEVRGTWVAPAFAPAVNAAGQLAKDFNDMLQLEGVERVRAQLGSNPQVEVRNFDVTNNLGIGKTATLTGGIDVINLERIVKMENATSAVKEQAPAKEPSERKAVGDYVLKLSEIPQETRDLAKTYFGARTNIYAAKENGGPYKGEVYNTEKYLIQEIGNRSVVIHDKAKMDVNGNQVNWMIKENKVNGHELQVYYEGDKANVYPYDRQRDNLERAVGSLKKSAKELGMPDIDKTLDSLKEQSWNRIKPIRKTESVQKEVKRTDSPEQPKVSGPKR